MRIFYGLLSLSSLVILARSDDLALGNSSDYIWLKVPRVQEVLEWERFLVQNCGFDPRVIQANLLEEVSEKVSEDLEREDPVVPENPPASKEPQAPADENIAHTTPISTEVHDEQGQLKPSGSKHPDETEFAEKQDTKQPDIPQPDIQQPAIQNQDNQNQNSHQTDAHQPDTQKSDVQQSDVPRPDIQQPDTQKPDTQQPDTQQPDTQQPDTQKQDTQKQDTQKQDTPQANRDYSTRSSSTSSGTRKPIGEPGPDSTFKSFWQDLDFSPIDPNSWTLKQYASVIGSLSSSILLSMRLVSAGKKWMNKRVPQETNSTSTAGRVISHADPSYKSYSSSDRRPTPISSNGQNDSSTPSDVAKRLLSEPREISKHEIIEEKTSPSPSEDTPSSSGHSSNPRSFDGQEDKFDQEGSSSYVIVDRQTDTAEDLDWQLDDASAKQRPKTTHRVTFGDHDKQSSPDEETTKDDTTVVDSDKGAVPGAKQSENNKSDAPDELDHRAQSSHSGTRTRSSARRSLDEEKKFTSDLTGALESMDTILKDEVTVGEGWRSGLSRRESPRTARSPTTRASLTDQAFRSPPWSRSSSSRGSPTSSWSRSRNRWSSPPGTGRTDATQSPHDPDNCFICIRNAQLQRGKATESAGADTNLGASTSNLATSPDIATTTSTSYFSPQQQPPPPPPLDPQEAGAGAGAGQTPSSSSLTEGDRSKRQSFRQTLSQVFTSSHSSSQSKSGASSLKSGGGDSGNGSGNGSSSTIDRIKSKFSSRGES